MTLEDALNLVTAILAPLCLSKLQIDVFRGTWHEHSYVKMAGELNHEYSYIKDIGSELWQLLSQQLGVKVTKRNLREALSQYQLLQMQSDRPALYQCRVDWGETPDVSLVLRTLCTTSQARGVGDTTTLPSVGDCGYGRYWQNKISNSVSPTACRYRAV